MRNMRVFKGDRTVPNRPNSKLQAPEKLQGPISKTRDVKKWNAYHQRGPDFAEIPKIHQWKYAKPPSGQKAGYARAKPAL